jgi:hypothetical protein
VDDARADKILWVRVDAIKELHAKANQLGADCCGIQWLGRFEDFLRPLLVSTKGKLSFRQTFKEMK